MGSGCDIRFRFRYVVLSCSLLGGPDRIAGICRQTVCKRKVVVGVFMEEPHVPNVPTGAREAEWERLDQEGWFRERHLVDEQGKVP